MPDGAGVAKDVGQAEMPGTVVSYSINGDGGYTLATIDFTVSRALTRENCILSRLKKLPLAQATKLFNS